VLSKAGQESKYMGLVKLDGQGGKRPSGVRLVE